MQPPLAHGLTESRNFQARSLAQCYKNTNKELAVPHTNVVLGSFFHCVASPFPSFVTISVGESAYSEGCSTSSQDRVIYVLERAA